LPKVIAPPGGNILGPPDNYTLCQIGFKWGLNYNFVCEHTDAPPQIFKFLQEAVAVAINQPHSNVQMNSIKPYCTLKTLGYVTTLALFSIPDTYVEALQNALHAPAGILYNNKDESVYNLTTLINPTVPLKAGTLPENCNMSPLGSTSSPTPTGGYGNDSPMGKGNSQKVNTNSVSIGLGVVAAGLAYGAAMFLVARRYRNKRLSHQRASSVPSTSHRGSASSMGAAWMTGARGAGRSTPGGRDSRGSGSSNGRSVRTAQISAPVMAENSLGWN
jgi:hypothetical protein